MFLDFIKVIIHVANFGNILNKKSNLKKENLPFIKLIHEVTHFYNQITFKDPQAQLTNHTQLLPQ